MTKLKYTLLTSAFIATVSAGAANAGTVFTDDGAGGGVASNGIQDGTEAVDSAIVPGSIVGTDINATTGTTNINTAGAGVTTIGTGGTGAVNIGNATGGTAVTGPLSVSGASATTGITNTGALANTGALTQVGTTNVNATGTAATNIGTGATSGTTTIGNATANNVVIHGLANGVLDGDAVNMRQFNGAVDDLKGGVASAIAIANIPGVPAGKQFAVGFGGGTYAGENAGALKLSFAPASMNALQVNASVALSNGDTGAGVGVSYGF